MKDQIEAIIHRFAKEILDTVLSMSLDDLAKLPSAYAAATKTVARRVLKKATPKLSVVPSVKSSLHRDPEQCRLANRYGYLLRALTPTLSAKMKGIREKKNVAVAVQFGDKMLGGYKKLVEAPKKASPKKVVPSHLRVQGRYLGLMRHAASNVKKAAQKVARSHGAKAAVAYLEQHR